MTGQVRAYRLIPEAQHVHTRCRSRETLRVWGMSSVNPVPLVALLRGINVGGKNKLDMKELKAAFERTGLRQVSTYINSGNILFQINADDESLAVGADTPGYQTLATRLEGVIRAEFGLNVPAVLRDLEQYRLVIEALPSDWTNDSEHKSDVMFLWDEIDSPDILDALPIRPDIDTVLYAPGAVLWTVPKRVVTKSGLMKLAGTDLYQRMTVRNVNTTRKLWELFQNLVD